MTRPRERRGVDGNSAVNAVTEAERKKLRNRLSQKAFRHRQAEYIRELENQAASLSKSDNEQIAALEKENRSLRSQLLDVHAKLESVQATLKSLSGFISGALDLSCKNAKDNKHAGPEVSEQPILNAFETASEQSSNQTVSQAMTSHSTSMEPTSTTTISNATRESLASANYTNMGFVIDLDQDEHQIGAFDHTESSWAEEIVDSTRQCWDVSTEIQKNAPPDDCIDSMLPTLSNIWTYQHQMGLDAYQRAFSASQETSNALGMDWAPSSSPFSEHLTTLKKCLHGKWMSMGSVFTTRPDLLSQSVAMVLSMFNSVTRPEAMMWYAKTRFYYIVDFTTWQLQPSPEALARVHPRYRPTALQIAGNYPCIIDWIPFASIRDRLILYHSANPQLDTIFCDAVSSYVVETQLSILVSGAQPIPIYVRVLDILEAMGNTTGNSGMHSETTLPVANVSMLFESQIYARLAFKELKMDRGISNYKIDPQFFSRYPELFDPSSDLMAKGIPIKSHKQTNLPSPRPLDNTTVGVYRSFTDFSLSVLWNTSLNRKW